MAKKTTSTIKNDDSGNWVAKSPKPKYRSREEMIRALGRTKKK